MSDVRDIFFPLFTQCQSVILVIIPNASETNANVSKINPVSSTTVKIGIFPKINVGIIVSNVEQTKK